MTVESSVVGSQGKFRLARWPSRFWLYNLIQGRWSFLGLQVLSCDVLLAILATASTTHLAAWPHPADLSTHAPFFLLVLRIDHAFQTRSGCPGRRGWLLSTGLPRPPRPCKEHTYLVGFQVAFRGSVVVYNQSCLRLKGVGWVKMMAMGKKTRQWH